MKHVMIQGMLRSAIFCLYPINAYFLLCDRIAFVVAFVYFKHEYTLASKSHLYNNGLFYLNQSRRLKTSQKETHSMGKSKSILTMQTSIKHIQPGMLILVLVLKDSLRTFFKSLSLSWSLGVRSLSLSWSLGVRSLSWSLGVRSLSLSWSLWSSPCPCPCPC